MVSVDSVDVGLDSSPFGDSDGVVLLTDIVLLEVVEGGKDGVDASVVVEVVVLVVVVGGIVVVVVTVVVDVVVVVLGKGVVDGLDVGARVDGLEVVGVDGGSDMLDSFCEDKICRRCLDKETSWWTSTPAT